MTSYFAEHALLPSGWARNVRFSVEAGSFLEVSVNASPGQAERLAGAVLPGMANLHSHAFQRAMAGLTESRGAPE
ncbi:MAG: formimidoylglutamate deiminase, partial [Betaproteobacteria bacterium]